VPSRPVDLVALGVATVLLRIRLVLATHQLSYDDGVYGLSVLALRGPARQYRDVFSGQGPLYMPLLRVGDLLGLQARWAPRMSGLLAAVLVTVLGTWLVGKAAGRLPALVAGTLLATSGQLIAVFGSIEADALVVAAGLVAVALALRGRGPVAVGLACAVTLSIKNLLGVPPVLAAALALGLVAHERAGTRAAVRSVGVAGAVAAGACVAFALPWGLSTVWDSSVTYHLDARGIEFTERPLALWHLVWHNDRTALLVGVLAAVGLLASPKVRRDAIRVDEATGRTLLTVAVWTAAALGVVLLHQPLFLQHPTALAVPLCLLVGLCRPWWPAAAGIVAVVAPLQVREVGVHLSWSRPTGRTATFIGDLRAAVPPEGLALSDEPGLLWWAGVDTPPELIDTSFVRIATGRLDLPTVLAAAARPDVCAVLAVSGRFEFLGLEQPKGFDLVHDYGDGRRLWVKPDCSPGG
jgi:hypothetical protein